MAKYKYSINSADNLNPDVMYFEPIIIILSDENDELILSIAALLDAVEDSPRFMEIIGINKETVSDTTGMIYPPE